MARRALRSLIGKGRAPEPETLHIAAEKAHPLPVVVPQHFRRARRDAEKVRCVFLESGAAQRIHNAVKSGGGDIFDEPRRAICGTHHVDDIETLVKRLHNLRNALRRMLEVCVHADHIALRVVDTRDHRGLVPEIPREMQDADAGVLRREAVQKLRASVTAPVIDKEEGIGDAAPLQHFREALPAKRQGLLLVKYRNHDGQDICSLSHKFESPCSRGMAVALPSAATAYNPRRFS